MTVTLRAAAGAFHRVMSAERGVTRTSLTEILGSTGLTAIGVALIAGGAPVLGTVLASVWGVCLAAILLPEALLWVISIPHRRRMRALEREIAALAAQEADLLARVAELEGLADGREDGVR